jgi:WD40 repeat protein
MCYDRTFFVSKFRQIWKNESVNMPSISPDGKFLASGTQDDTIRFWDLPTASNIGTFSTWQAKWPADDTGPLVLALAFSPNGTMMASAGDGIDRTIKLWDITLGK